MRLGNRLIVVAAAIFVAAVGAAHATRYDAQEAVPRPAVLPSALPVQQSEIAGEFAGSNECARCHAAEHGQWARSLHVRMTKPAAEALIAGDFDNVSFADHGRAYRMETRDGRRYVSVSHGGRPAERFEVHYTLGAKRFQGYLTRLPDGRLYVLPAFWHVAQRRWVDWKEITPVPDGDHDLRQIWNVTCFNCHATNLDAKYDAASKSYATEWTEMGLGCEACHGPGRPHIALMDAWQKQGITGAPGDDIRIFAPRRAEPRQVFDMCAYCHGNKNNLFLGFLPGRRMEDFALPFLVSQPMPADDPQGDFWPDGRPSRFNRPQALTLSGCFIKGSVTCTNCHVAHGSRNEHSLKVPIEESDRLCTQCHETVRAQGPALRAQGSGRVATSGAALEGHTRHSPESQGSRCIECHMSDVNWRLLIRRRDHTFAAPVPEITAKYGVPNACTTCHEGRSPEWAAGLMDAWYGDRDRRDSAMKVADAFYLAGSGDAASLPALASLAVDRSRGMLVRASAAEFIGLVVAAAAGAESGIARGGPSQTSTEGGAAPAPAPQAGTTAEIAPELRLRLVNSLMGAANDPEPTVRAVSVRSLGVLADLRAIPAITARLRDDVRAVRVAAAEALLWMDVTALPGAAGELLTRAQDEYAQSMAAFPDVVSNYVKLGWLETQRGRHARAAEVLDDAIRFEPNMAVAHLYRGIVAVRTGQPAEAIRYWEKAKALDPSLAAIDRMIEEARKQVGAGRGPARR
jgi:predicted CXXCH cytochrome family protein